MGKNQNDEQEIKDKESDENLIDSEEINEEIFKDLKSSSRIILIVDDILYVVKSIARILKEEGFFVMTAHTADEAIKKYEKYSPDLVTIDQMLPDMLGTKLVQEIKNRDTNKSTKIIFISSIYDKEKIKSILQMGVDHYLLKPVTRSTLVSTVKNLFNNEK